MRTRGMSSLEILIVCLMIGLLVSISLPVFSDHTLRARRTEAYTALLALNQAQEQYRSRHATYASSLAELDWDDESEGLQYRLSTHTDADSAATDYRVVAQGQRAQANDTACLHLALVIRGGRISEQSGPTAALTNDSAANRLCWRQ